MKYYDLQLLIDPQTAPQWEQILLVFTFYWYDIHSMNRFPNYSEQNFLFSQQNFNPALLFLQLKVLCPVIQIIHLNIQGCLGICIFWLWNINVN